MLIHRSVTTHASPRTVFEYLADFTTTNKWDPGTVTTTRTRGDGGMGTEYHNVSRFLGRTTELTYTVEEYVPGVRITLRGENASVTAHDTITVTPQSLGARVDYRAEFSLKGLARFMGPLLAPAFHRLGNEAEVGLSKALNELPS